MNRVITLLLGVGLAVPGLLRAGVDTAWVRRYDGPAYGADAATSIAVDTAGNVYVVGYSEGVGTGGDFVTIKYSPTGDTLWTRRQDFSAHDKPTGLAVDSQSNVYVTGTTDVGMATVKYNSSGLRLWYELLGSQGGANDLALDRRGNVLVCGSLLRNTYDATTVKYRPDGDTAWVRFFDWAGYEDYAMALAVGQMGDVAVTGFGAHTGTHYDATTVHYDSLGDRSWVAGYDGPDHGVDRSLDVVMDDNGCVVIAGYSDNGYTTPYDYLTVKYDPQGETLWVRRYNGTANGDDEAEAVAVDPSGNILVTGYVTLGADSGPQCTTIKYSPAGDTLWVARFERGGAQSVGYAVAVDSANNVYVTGGVAPAGDYSECLTVKYSPIGDTVWVRSFDAPGSLAEDCSAIALSRDGSVCVTGLSYGEGPNADFITIKYVQDGGVAGPRQPISPTVSIVALPNPATTLTTVTLGLQRGGPVLVQVLDVSGRIVRTLNRGQLQDGWHSLIWDRTDDRGTRVPAGVYMVVLNASGVSTRVKVAVLD